MEEALKPVRFRELLGQDRARAQLVQAAAGGRLPHAYLFCGIEGSGRRSAARMLAARLNCTAPEGDDACGGADPAGSSPGAPTPTWSASSPRPRPEEGPGPRMAKAA